VNAGRCCCPRRLVAAFSGPMLINGGFITETTNVNQLNTRTSLITSPMGADLTFSTGYRTHRRHFHAVLQRATTTAITILGLASTLQTAIPNRHSTPCPRVVWATVSLSCPAANTVQIVFQAALGGTAQNTMGTGSASLLRPVQRCRLPRPRRHQRGTLDLGANPLPPTKSFLSTAAPFHDD